MKINKLSLQLLSAVLVITVATACASTATPPATINESTPTAMQLSTTGQATTSPGTGTTTTGEDLSGAALYQMSCAACHGQDRGGITFEDEGQTIEVPALTWDELNPTYQTLPSRGTPAQQLALSITKGLDENGEDLNTMMPRWSSLSQAQVESLVQLLQTPPDSSGVVPTLTTAGMNLMGEQLYQSTCAACHGQDGAGQKFEMDGNEISVPSLSWSELTQTYSTDPNRGSVVEQLSQAIVNGLDEEGGDLNPMMPKWTFLSQAQIDSLIQYIQAQFQ